MNFTFNVTVTIYDGDIDNIVELVKEGWDIDKAIEAVISCYDEFEWGCLSYYRWELKKEIERRVENNEV